MKEKIYTIPINDAVDKGCFCPLCYLENKLDEEAVDYTLGPAMMEPDFRIITNEKGFCRRHTRDLCGKRDALSLALVFDTHLDALATVMEEKPEKKSLLRKKKGEGEDFVAKLKQIAESCAICSKVEKAFEQYLHTFAFMLKKEEGFLEKVLSKEGFCMEHFSRLAEVCREEFSQAEFERLFYPLLELQKKRLEKQQGYIEKFEAAFDYRNAGKKLDAPKDTLHLAGMFLNGVFDTKKD